MNKFEEWYIKHLDRRIQKYEHYIERCKEWIRNDKKELQEQWKSLELSDRIRLGYEMGYTVKCKKIKK